jgi:hypothetical protein
MSGFKMLFREIYVANTKEMYVFFLFYNDQCANSSYSEFEEKTKIAIRLSTDEAR